MSDEIKQPGDNSISGKTVIVTGGGYGIGKQIALAFGRSGANVTVAARSQEKLESVANQLKEMNTDPLSLRVDISSESDVRSMVDKVMEKYQSIDVLVNNSAIYGPTSMVPEMDSD